MQNFIEWLSYNKQWFFSGVGVLIITIIISFVTYFFRKRTMEKKLSQFQKSGGNSFNLQSGRDTEVNFNKEKK